MNASEFAFIVLVCILGIPFLLIRMGIRPFGEREIGDIFGGRFARYPAIFFLLMFVLLVFAVVLLEYLRSLSQE